MDTPAGRRAGRGRRSWALAAGLLACTARAGAGEPPDRLAHGAEPAEPAAARAERPASPRVIGDLGVALQRALRFGYALAAQRLREAPRCAGLFGTLGADGIAELERSSFSSALAEVCAHGVAALTSVGQPRVRLCPGFAVLDTKRAARTLIHEALHVAGLRERPPDRAAPSAEEINRLVEAGCDL